MPYYLLSAETTFAAAHTLPGVPKCDRLHGHNWRVGVTVRVALDDLDERGMGVDFRLIEQILQDAVAEFDHRHLNELPTFRDAAPTAERVARIVAERIAARLPDVAPAARLEELALWEMPQYCVVYRPQ